MPTNPKLYKPRAVRESAILGYVFGTAISSLLFGFGTVGKLGGFEDDAMQGWGSTVILTLGIAILLMICYFSIRNLGFPRLAQNKENLEKPVEATMPISTDPSENTKWMVDIFVSIMILTICALFAVLLSLI